jgi:hypothetical protein
MGPAGACHWAGPPGPAFGRPDGRLRPDPVGRPDGRLRVPNPLPRKLGRVGRGVGMLGFAHSMMLQLHRSDRPVSSLVGEREGWERSLQGAGASSLGAWLPGRATTSSQDYRMHELRA